MPTFRYRAVTRDGKPDEGQMVAADTAAVIRRLQENGRIPIVAEESRSFPRRRSAFSRLVRRRSQHVDVLAFTRSLATLLAAGTPVDRALDIMLEVDRDAETRSLVRELQSDLRGGSSFTAALRDRSEIFSDFYSNMVFAAETGGELGDGLQRLVTYLERTHELRERVRSALIYPGILLVVAGISVIVLLTLVIPQFRPMFEDMGDALPLATRAVLASSNLFAKFGWLLLLGAIGTVAALRNAFRNPAFRERADRLILKLPVAGELVLIVETARFSRTLGTLLNSGVAVLQGLEIAVDTLTNRPLRSAVRQTASTLKEGGSLSDTLTASRVFPPLAIQMIKVGEESGRIEEMMLRVADIYDREADVSVRRALALFEPVMIVGLGVLIAGIIMSVLVGIISVNDLPM